MTHEQWLELRGGERIKLSARGRATFKQMPPERIGTVQDPRARNPGCLLGIWDGNKHGGTIHYSFVDLTGTT